MLVEHDHVCDLICLRQVVRDEHGELAPLAQRLTELARKLASQRGIKRRERLVEQQHIRIGRKRARERDALLLAARQIGGIARRQGAQSHLFDEGRRAIDPFDTIRDVFGDRHVRE